MHYARTLRRHAQRHYFERVVCVDFGVCALTKYMLYMWIYVLALARIYISWTISYTRNETTPGARAHRPNPAVSIPSAHARRASRRAKRTAPPGAQSAPCYDNERMQQYTERLTTSNDPI